MLKGHILITGGSGFLGRGILRQAAKESWPCQFTCYSRDEYKQDLCRRKYPEARYILGDVRDSERLRVAMAGHDIVIHTAALKYIPEAEFNVAEAIDVNVGGSQNVIQAAEWAGIQKVVGISTDKAVRPVNTYGFTKALLERMFGEAANRLGTKFTCVRYGNVVGSTGSVIPLFQRQRKEQNYLTVTDVNMTRFWLSLQEAIDLILLALEEKTLPGAIIVPLARSMKIYDLARLIGNGCRIDITGIRPGEKLHEELIHYQESVRAWRRHNFYELQPITMGTIGEAEPFTVTSHTPSYWMTEDEMAELIVDAETV